MGWFMPLWLLFARVKGPREMGDTREEPLTWYWQCGPRQWQWLVSMVRSASISEAELEDRVQGRDQLIVLPCSLENPLGGGCLSLTLKEGMVHLAAWMKEVKVERSEGMGTASPLGGSVLLAAVQGGR
jgi:hypothetical protein